MKRLCSGLLAAGLALTACGGDDPRTVSYRANSSEGADVEVTYRGEDGEVTEVVSTPWTLDVEFSGDFSAALEVRNLGLTGDVSCELTSEELPPLDTGGEAAAFCRMSVRSEGGGTSVSSSTDFELFVRDADGNAVAPPPEPIPLRGADLGRAVPDDRDLLLGSHQAIFVLDLEAGTVEDHREFSKPTDPARTDDGTLVATSYFDGTVEALAPGAEDVTILAEYPDERPSAVWFVDGELLVTLGEPDDLVRLGLDGAERWRVSTPGEIIDVVEVGDRVLAVTDERDSSAVLAIDPATGEIDQTIGVGPEPVALAASGGSVLVRHRDEFVIHLDASAYPTVSTAATTEPGQRAFFGTDGWGYRQDGLELHRLDPATGSSVASIDVGDRRAVAVTADRIYLIGEDGRDPAIVVLPTSLFG